MPHTPLSGGETTVFDATRDAFSLPAPGLSDEHRRQFFVGNSFFNQNWLEAPASIETRDGLGPLFNARSCSACHFKDGRSRPPQPGQPLSTMLLRISASVGGTEAFGPDPAYGDQIQGNAVSGATKEADVLVSYRDIEKRLPDGEPYVLHEPHYEFQHLGYGPLSERVALSARVAPALVGLGLLEAVPESVLAALSDPADRDHDGISGRINHVPDVLRKQLTPGRFGWKAEQPSVLQQSASAFLGDMGLTTQIFAEENVSDAEGALRALPSGGSPEVTPDVLRAISIYARVLAVPARRNEREPSVMRGEDSFERLGCAACHVPTLKTETLAELPELRAQEVHPYTDLLLHDLGDELSDHRPTFEALGSEWRTPPLWGVGLVSKVNGHTRFLHDGRASDLKEAILWHGGEASAARARFMQSSAVERAELLLFLESL
jgi:CxxC motif-containing protein (DUF1111 family)